MAVNTYTIGTRVRVQAKFYDDDGVLADPTAVSGQYHGPDGEIVVVDAGDITNVSVGIYEFDIDPDAAGTWEWRIAGTGDVLAALEAGFLVKRSNFV